MDAWSIKAYTLVVMTHFNIVVIQYQWFTTMFRDFLCNKVILNIIHTYIHNWSLQPFSQDYGLASYTTHVVFVNFMCEWRDLQLYVDSERQNFEKLFHSEICWEEVAEEIFFIFHVWWLTWDTNPGFCV